MKQEKEQNRNRNRNRNRNSNRNKNKNRTGKCRKRNIKGIKQEQKGHKTGTNQNKIVTE